MTADRLWLDAVWPFVRDQLPSSAATVLEIGCGPLGGFVPMMRRAGHPAVGVDPRAPAAPGYQQVEFERYEPPHRFDAVVACTSLHHVADLDDVLDRIAATLVPRGVLVVMEWAWERVDEATAHWCFDRLDGLDEPSWLSQRRDEWRGSGVCWDAYFTRWAKDQGLHPSWKVRRGLDERFDCQLAEDGPYFFPDLEGTSEADEQAAIDTGAVRPTATKYVGRLRRHPPRPGLTTKATPAAT